MPVMQNRDHLPKEKSMPPSTAKPLSMDAAAIYSRKKYQVLWVNWACFIEVTPAKIWIVSNIITQFSQVVLQ